MKLYLKPIKEKHTSIRVDQEAWNRFRTLCASMTCTQGQLLSAMIHKTIEDIEHEDLKIYEKGGGKS